MLLKLFVDMLVTAETCMVLLIYRQSVRSEKGNKCIFESLPPLVSLVSSNLHIDESDNTARDQLVRAVNLLVGKMDIIEPDVKMDLEIVQSEIFAVATFS